MDFGKRVKDVLTTGAAKTRDLYSRARSAQRASASRPCSPSRSPSWARTWTGSTPSWEPRSSRSSRPPGKASVSRSAAGVKPIMDGITTLLDTVAQKKKQLAAMKRGGAEGK